MPPQNDHAPRILWWINSSFVGILLGPLIVIGAMFLLFWNEGHAIQAAAGLREVARMVVEAPADHVLPDNEGRLVHIIGAATAAGSLEDSDLKLRFSDQVSVERAVEMYQWMERTGGVAADGDAASGYTQQWSSKEIDSSSFRQPKGHANPAMTLTSRRFTANDASLGAFVLDMKTLALMALDRPLQIAAPGGWTRSGLSLYLGKNPSTPAVGDLRVRYTGLLSGTTISILAQQSHDGFAAFVTPDGHVIQTARAGNMPAGLMFSDLGNTGSPLRWILRLAGVAILVAGFSLFFAPLQTMAAGLRFLKTAVRGAPVGFAVVLALPVAIATIAVAWLAFRPVLGAALVLVALNAAYILWRWHQSRTADRHAAPNLA